MRFYFKSSHIINLKSNQKKPNSKMKPIFFLFMLLYFSKSVRTVFLLEAINRELEFWGKWIFVFTFCQEDMLLWNETIASFTYLRFSSVFFNWETSQRCVMKLLLLMLPGSPASWEVLLLWAEATWARPACHPLWLMALLKHVRLHQSPPCISQSPHWPDSLFCWEMVSTAHRCSPRNR